MSDCVKDDGVGCLVGLMLYEEEDAYGLEEEKKGGGGNAFN